MRIDGNGRYFVLVALLLGAVVTWQFGTHEGPDLNPLDDSDVTSGAATPAVRIAPSTAAAHDLGRLVETLDHRTGDPAAYVADQVMVRVDRTLLATVARQHGTAVAKDVGISGYGAIAVPAGSTPQQFAQALLVDEWVVDAAPIGIMYGAGQDAPTTLADYQWHIDGVQRPADPESFDLENLKVAVLDTGLAYEDHEDGVGLETLDNTNISDPWDFVNDDDKPYDDHQHGSHIASVIASQDLEGNGDVTGVAPEVSVMPVKVLDADNAGNELSLLDALTWAVEKDADVINMSLSFAEGYVGSRALMDALDAAWDADAVMVAAAGNDGAGFTSWPAAHKRVIAVGATAMKNVNHTELATYSNDHPRVDLVAPGGAIGADRDKNDVDDGILAQTIALNDPLTSQYVLYAGTSQATAMVSAAAAYLLAEGVHPRKVRHVMQRSASQPIGELGYLYGTGSGCLDIGAALSSIQSSDYVDDGAQRFVALMPYLRYTDETHTNIEPVAQITVVDEGGSLVSGAEVYGAWSGSTGGFFGCTTGGSGQCVVAGTATAADADDLVWSVEVPTVVDGGVAYHPDAAFFATDEIAVMLAAMADDPAFDGSLLAFFWEEEVDPDLGDLAEAYFFVDTGVGLGSCPLGIILPPRTLGGSLEMSEIDLDLDGTGLGSCPLGTFRARLLVIDGTGLGSCPLGLPCRTPFGGLGGGGLGSCPLGRPLKCFFGPGGTGDDSIVLDFTGEAVMLGSSVTSSATLEGTPFGDVLGAGGWVTEDGDYGGASILLGNGTVTAVPAQVGVAGSGAGTLEFAQP